MIRVVGYEHVRNEAFLQWIRETGEAERPNVVERTVVIPELAGWRITEPQFRLNRSHWKIVVRAEREDPLSDTRKIETKFFTVVPAPDFTYRLSESRARPSI